MVLQEYSTSGILLMNNEELEIMKGNKYANPLDVRIELLIAEFRKIPNYDVAMQDDTLRKVHSFFAVRLTALITVRDLVVQTFLPAVKNDILKLNRYIATSKYKPLFRVNDFDTNDTLYETMRMAYVLTFHKYESLMKEQLELWESFTIETTRNTNQTFEKYLDSSFGFKVKSWHEVPSVHIFQFISNCTKHRDGKCALDNPSYSKPKRFTNTSDEETIKPTLKEYKEDFQNLMESINRLVQILGFTLQTRLLESFISEDKLSGESYRLNHAAKMQPMIDDLKVILTDLIGAYKQL